MKKNNALKFLPLVKKLNDSDDVNDLNDGDSTNKDNDKLQADLIPGNKAEEKEWLVNGWEIEYLKKLGSGTSGDVYKGLYKDQHVAIKVLKEMTEDKEKDEFKKEFVVLCAVHHPNIVKFYGASFKPKLCMVMEYCSRGSLYHVLKDKSLNIGWSLALNMMKQSALGIEALHNNSPQILHRDLKSLNLLITEDWGVKVADFGLSRFDTAEALETLKQMRGTFAYCAPESYHGAKYSDKSDMYSLGIIYIEIINRIILGKYSQPYSEYKYITFDFQIIIHASKDGLRPTMPENTPKILRELVDLCVHKEIETRPMAGEVVNMVNNIMEEYSSHKEEWDAIVSSIEPNFSDE